MPDTPDAPEGATPLEWRNATALPDGRYDCDVYHPVYGWGPYTASADDVDEKGRMTHASILASYS